MEEVNFTVKVPPIKSQGKKTNVQVGEEIVRGCLPETMKKK